MPASTTIIIMKMAKSGANFPTSAVRGLPPAALSQVLRLRRENSDPTAYPAGDCGDDVQDRGQYGAQEKLRVVQRRIGQNILLDYQRPGRIRLIVRCARQASGGRRDRVGYRRRGAVARGEILSIVERDDFRASPGDEIALEMLGDVDRGDRVARADRVCGARHIAGAVGDADARRRSDRLDIDQRGRGAVRVHDGYSEIADDCVAEDQR